MLCACPGVGCRGRSSHDQVGGVCFSCCKAGDLARAPETSCSWLSYMVCLGALGVFIGDCKVATSWSLKEEAVFGTMGGFLTIPAVPSVIVTLRHSGSLCADTHKLQLEEGSAVVSSPPVFRALEFVSLGAGIMAHWAVLPSHIRLQPPAAPLLSQRPASGLGGGR